MVNKSESSKIDRYWFPQRHQDNWMDKMVCDQVDSSMKVIYIYVIYIWQTAQN